MKLQVAGEHVTTQLVAGGVEVTMGGLVFRVAVERRADGVLLVDGKPAVVEAGSVGVGGDRFDVQVVSERGPPLAAFDAARGLSSPTPATVSRVLVAVGEDVKAGQALIVLVAMKTELTLVAPRAGRVLAVNAVAQQSVRAGATLVELTA